MSLVLIPLALISAQSEQGNTEVVFSGISALAAVAAALVAWWAIRSQNKRAQLTLSVNLTWQFTDRFESADFKKTRGTAAGFILRVTADDGTLNQALVDADSDRLDLIEVLNLFDDLGTLVRSGAIDSLFIWNTFSPTVQQYWLGAKPIVEYWRTSVERPFALQNADYLSEKLISYDQERLGRINPGKTARTSRTEVRSFLANESSIWQ